MYNYQGHIAPLFLELRRIFSEGAMQAALALGIDHANRTPKPWTYYLGVGVGGMAIASGIPNASLIIYCAAAALDLLIFKSPEGGLVDVFIDGVAATNIVTFSANQIWEAYTVNVNSPNRVAKVEFRARDTDANGDPVSVNWFSVGNISAVGGTIEPRIQWNEAPPWKITISLRDSQGRRASFKLYAPYFVEAGQLQRYVETLIDALLPVTAGRFVNVSFSKSFVPNSMEPAASDGSAYGRTTLTVPNDDRTSLVKISIPTWRESFTRLEFGKGRLPDFNQLVTARVEYVLLEPHRIENPFTFRLCDERGVALQTRAWKKTYTVRKR